jgi:putative flippase GtrA
MSDKKSPVTMTNEKELLKRQLRRFIVVGVCAVTTDSILYFTLTAVIENQIAISKATSFIGGTFVAYLLNKLYTFEQKRYSTSELIRFILLYISTLLINTSVNSLILILLTKEFKVVAFLCATGISATLNFLGQKYIVFKA